jgi:ACT domain-containing protein
MKTRKAIITVISEHRVGIVAGVTAQLASRNNNILDISQTIMDNFFTMTLLVDVAAANCPFEDISAALTDFGARENLSIRIQREEIFTAMHRI